MPAPQAGIRICGLLARPMSTALGRLQLFAPRNGNGAHPCAPCLPSERGAPAVGRALVAAVRRRAAGHALSPESIGPYQGGHAHRPRRCAAGGTGRLRRCAGSRRGDGGGPCCRAEVVHERLPGFSGQADLTRPHDPVAITCRTPVRRRFLFARRFPSTRRGHRPPRDSLSRQALGSARRHPPPQAPSGTIRRRSPWRITRNYAIEFAPVNIKKRKCVTAAH